MLIKIFFGLIEMTFGLVHASYSLPERADFLCTLTGLGIIEKWSYSCTCTSGKNSEHPLNKSRAYDFPLLYTVKLNGGSNC